MNSSESKLIDDLICAEHGNVTHTMDVLGPTLDLTQDISDLYLMLGESALRYDPTISPDSPLAVMLYLANRCNALLSSATLAVLRRYEGQSLGFLRQAMEACAIINNLAEKPELAD